MRGIKTFISRALHGLLITLPVIFLSLLPASVRAQPLATTGYDGHGRLVSYSQSGSISLAHSYNGLGDRTATTSTPSGGNADTRRFVTAPDGRIIGEYGTSATDVKAEFIWLSPTVGDTGPFGGGDGLGGYMPIAMVNGTTLSWVHGDHLGTPIVMTNATGTAIAQPSGYYATAFPGQSKTLADLYYNRYRDYDPSTGRYIQADPIGLAGGANPYSYAMGNPLRYTDPTGEFVQVVAICALNPTACAAVAIGGATLVYSIYNYYATIPDEYRLYHRIFGPGCPEALYTSSSADQNSNISVPYVHPNSHQSLRPTEVYHLINRDTDDIDKIGITSPGQRPRYSDPWLRANNVKYQTVMQYESRYPAVVHENIELTFYLFSHGQLPKLNNVTR
jgi:RHS repeat-associated protein